MLEEYVDALSKFNRWITLFVMGFARWSWELRGIEQKMRVLDPHRLECSKCTFWGRMCFINTFFILAESNLCFFDQLLRHWSYASRCQEFSLSSIKHKPAHSTRSFPWTCEHPLVRGNWQFAWLAGTLWNIQSKQSLLFLYITGWCSSSGCVHLSDIFPIIGSGTMWEFLRLFY